jgi:N-acetylglucosaminyldiphosphoundecaprenol N-acetyl-beta-D-mannosaminyltransferase
MTEPEALHRRITDHVERRSRSRSWADGLLDNEVSYPSVRLGQIHTLSLTLDEATAAILTRARSGRGGFVVTPNVDHICLAEQIPELRAAYRQAFLSLPDGQPLMWMARLLGTPLAEKISGSDLIHPLLDMAAAQGCSVFFLGATEDTCAEAARRLREDIPDLHVCGWASPFFDPNGDQNQLDGALEKIRAQQPDLILVAMSAPKQELLMLRYYEAFAPSVVLGIGAGIDFIAGKVQRAPRWMSRYGLEWLFRLSCEPGRMWRRYLVRDRAIFGIFLRTRREAIRRRAYGGSGN